jgi:hypothetical protein
MSNCAVYLAMILCWHGASTRSQDPDAFTEGRAAVGPLQITRILAADVGMLDCYPARFNADRDPRLPSSVSRMAFYLAAAQLERRLGYHPTVREIQLAWRHGYERCRKQGWEDPEGYLELCEREVGR